MSKPATLEDVLDYVVNEAPLKHLSRRDYASAVRRLPLVMGANRLADITADLDAIKARLYPRKYDRDLFKSVAAYRAWRRKVLAALRLFLGILDAERADRKKMDGWTRLRAEADLLIADGQLDLHVNALLPLVLLTKIARASSLEPWQIDNAYIVARSCALPARDVVKFRRSVRLIGRLQDMAPRLRDLLPTERISDFEIVRRGPLPPIPRLLLDEVDAWIAKHGRGEIDPISGEFVDGMSRGTVTGYRSAFRSYLGHAERSGLLVGASSLEEALKDEISVPVMQSMISGPEPKQQISTRTMLQYLETVVRLATLEGIEVSEMKNALARNRNLNKGKIERRQMSAETKKFCAWLLSSRANEMLFRSFHIRLQKRALNLMSQLDAGRRMKHTDQRVVQAGSLAAMAAIWLWGAPLRVENVVSLRLYGTDPQIFPPQGKRREALIKIAAEETKNKRQIDHRILPGKHRAIEVLMWYIDEVRPLIPDAEDSIYLFPSRVNRNDAISAAAVRTWLRAHAVEEGLQVNPHQFRHGLASLYIRAHPGSYDHVAQILDDEPETVRRFYAWIDKEVIMTEIQSNVLKMAGF